MNKAAASQEHQKLIPSKTTTTVVVDVPINPGGCARELRRRDSGEVVGVKNIKYERCFCSLRQPKASHTSWMEPI